MSKKILLLHVLFLTVAILFPHLNALGGDAQKSTNIVVGAFGLKLGEVFDTTKATLVERLQDGEICNSDHPAYLFTPEKPVPPFEKYYVQVTPKSHRVFAILAVVHDSQQLKKKEQIDVVVSGLSDKYSPYVYGKDKPNDAKRFWFYAEFAERNVAITMGFGHLGQHVGMPVFTLSYRDDSLQKLASDEQKEKAQSENEAQQRKVEEKAKTLDKSAF